ncbi:MAG: hypothetical protein M1827_001841 [Pycnora praestabilis]|nr:MAG: hypothetical protein M1827_001841 [Pycnora praestabilis]
MAAKFGRLLTWLLWLRSFQVFLTAGALVFLGVSFANWGLRNAGGLGRNAVMALVSDALAFSFALINLIMLCCATRLSMLFASPWSHILVLAIDLLTLFLLAYYATTISFAGTRASSRISSDHDGRYKYTATKNMKAAWLLTLILTLASIPVILATSIISLYQLIKTCTSHRKAPPQYTVGGLDGPSDSASIIELQQQNSQATQFTPLSPTSSPRKLNNALNSLHDIPDRSPAHFAKATKRQRDQGRPSVISHTGSPIADAVNQTLAEDLAPVRVRPEVVLGDKELLKASGYQTRSPSKGRLRNISESQDGA